MITRTPLAVPLVALAGLLALLALTMVGWAPLAGLDAAVSAAFRGYGTDRPGLIAVLRIATDVAATGPFLAAGLLATLVLAAARRRRPAVFCAVVTVLVPVTWSLLHLLLHHPRPVDGFVVATSNGFPSGHTSNAAAAALAAVLLLWHRLGRPARVALAVLAAAFAVLIGLTRVALLAHWPVDVLGGWLLALTLVPLAARLAGSDRVAADRTGAGPTARGPVPAG
ncbi:phosphatase PAP2 family protein [Micromonospora zhanjiangensis]|uniref:Phosphatase PAP2 family protein n=1 Tax=Micromonospora zhanjiangensis TaxID=1522057 RepID=A0ABV8KI04_9ACTN